jgi:hypothetical protein
MLVVKYLFVQVTSNY